MRKREELNLTILCICGSREFTNKEFLFEKVDEVAAKFKDIAIIEGGAKGADELAVEYAVERGIPYAEFAADWDNLGKAAGPIRNGYMAENCDAVVAFKLKGKENKGTNNMINQAKKLGRKIYVYEI